MTGENLTQDAEFATADLCDEYGATIQAGHGFGSPRTGTLRCQGEVSTVLAPDDNSIVREALNEPGNGRVLVVDAHASMRVAVLGGYLTSVAVENDWAGILVNGCVRDQEELKELDIAIFSLGSCPRATVKNGWGMRDVPVTFAGLTYRPGYFVYVDVDGVVVSAEKLV